ncbi:MAG: hypothetical protein AABZ47_14505 [Planctomycetota bacterium]
MEDRPAYFVDIGYGPSADDANPSANGTPRPWVGIQFHCCGVYHRIYRDSKGTSYSGRCPKCLRPVTLRIGPNGTSSRFFAAE